MKDDPSPVGFKNPPVETRFQKGQSGNPRGRLKRKSDFFADAADILGGAVTGQANEKTITLPMLQAMFRALCRKALQGDNQALQRIIGLQLTLIPAADAKAADEEAEGRDARQKLAKAIGLDPDRIDWKPKEKTPEQKAEDGRIAGLVEIRRKELKRGAKR